MAVLVDATRSDDLALVRLAGLVGSLVPRPRRCGAVAWMSAVAAAGAVRSGAVVVEAAADELDEDVLERRLGLAQGEDVGAQATERPDDTAERAVLLEDEVEATVWRSTGPSSTSAAGAADTTPGSRASAAAPPSRRSSSSRKIDSRWTRCLSSSGVPMARIRPWSTMAMRSHSSSASAM